jgi:hypothetical protein
MSRLQAAVSNIAFARSYTLWFLDGLPESDWFRMPPGGVTHIAWQVAHLAFAQYRLALDRIRGVRPEDANLIADSFLDKFARDSLADPDPARHPPVSEIRAIFDRVHETVMAEVSALPESELDAPVLKPHRIVKTKLESLIWCANHELVHAGQIALLRRFHGHAPLW